jgi:hypothetical protein
MDSVSPTFFSSGFDILLAVMSTQMIYATELTGKVCPLRPFEVLVENI